MTRCCHAARRLRTGRRGARAVARRRRCAHRPLLEHCTACSRRKLKRYAPTPRARRGQRAGGRITAARWAAARAARPPQKISRSGGLHDQHARVVLSVDALVTARVLHSSLRRHGPRRTPVRAATDPDPSRLSSTKHLLHHAKPVYFAPVAQGAGAVAAVPLSRGRCRSCRRARGGPFALGFAAIYGCRRFCTGAFMWRLRRALRRWCAAPPRLTTSRPALNHGVTAPLFDILFGTRPACPRCCCRGGALRQGSSTKRGKRSATHQALRVAALTQIISSRAPPLQGRCPLSTPAPLPQASRSFRTRRRAGAVPRWARARATHHSG